MPAFGRSFQRPYHNVVATIPGPDPRRDRRRPLRHQGRAGIRRRKRRGLGRGGAARAGAGPSAPPSGPSLGLAFFDAEESRGPGAARRPSPTRATAERAVRPLRAGGAARMDRRRSPRSARWCSSTWSATAISGSRWRRTPTPDSTGCSPPPPGRRRRRPIRRRGLAGPRRPHPLHRRRSAGGGSDRLRLRPRAEPGRLVAYATRRPPPRLCSEPGRRGRSRARRAARDPLIARRNPAARLPFGGDVLRGTGAPSTTASRPSGSCSPPRAATAPASTAPCRRSSGRSSSTAPPVYVRKEIVHNKHVVEELAKRGAIFVEQETEVPEGEMVVFSAHGVAPAVHENAAARAPAHDRRHLPAGDQGPRRRAPLRRRGLHDRDDRPRGPRGGRRDDRRGAAKHRPDRNRRRGRRARGPRPRQGRLHHPDDALGRRDGRDHRRPARQVPGDRQLQVRRHLLRDDQPPDRRQAARPRVRPGPGDRLDQLLQLQPPGRGRARARRRLAPDRQPHPGPGGVAGGSRDGRHHLRRQRPRGAGREPRRLLPRARRRRRLRAAHRPRGRPLHAPEGDPDELAARG